MILSGNGRLQISALLMVFVAIRWPDALASNSIRPGKRMHPMGKAPVIIASAPAIRRPRQGSSSRPFSADLIPDVWDRSA